MAWCGWAPLAPPRTPPCARRAMLTPRCRRCRRRRRVGVRAVGRPPRAVGRPRAPPGAGCWISSTLRRELDSGTAWRFACFYGPLWAAELFNFVVYSTIIRTVRQYAQSSARGNEQDTSKLLRLVRRLQLYPLILIVIWFWGTVNRIQNSISPRDPQYWLTVLQARRVLFSLSRSLRSPSLSPSLSVSRPPPPPFVVSLVDSPRACLAGRVTRHSDPPA